ncbi:MAG: monovalent cation/H+ antiporter complex subunit F [Chlamydiota bacterium]
MIDWFYYLCDILICLAVIIGAIRFVKGPTTLDRILAFDFITVCVAAAVILYSIQLKTSYYIEVLIIFCLLGFTTTLAFMDSLFREKEERES